MNVYQRGHHVTVIPIAIAQVVTAQRHNNAHLNYQWVRHRQPGSARRMRTA
jgi:hypothetical protein